MNDLKIRADLQRLVDGELSHARRSQVLRDLPANSKIWRDLALAFVERQVLDEAISARSVNHCETELESCNDGGPSDDQSTHLNPSNRVRTDRAQTWTSRAIWATAIGACFLIGLGIGKWQSPAGPEDSVARVASADLQAESQHKPNLDSQRETSSWMPLAEALSRAAYPIPVDLRREMMKSGYLITELDQLSKVQLPTGQWVELPVREVAVTYLGTATYQ